MALTPRRRRQGSDGAWRPSLLNASGFPVAETTGTANFAYGFAWGIRTGLLPCATHHHCPGLWLRVLCSALHPLWPMLHVFVLVLLVHLHVSALLEG